MVVSAPPPVPPIAVDGLTKRFGRGANAVLAVDDLTFAVAPGRVTGFLGPNGSGKTTTLRCLLGLVTADRGSARIQGHRYAALSAPTRTVGAGLEATGFHPGRKARDHLRIAALAGGIASHRVGVVLDLVGLSEAGNRRVGAFSLGMRQRLLLAEALLGDPQILVLDEPANGLDPEGISWLRQFLRDLANQGRTVLISSHVLSEVQQTVDDVVIIGDGKLVIQAALADLVAEHAAESVLVQSPQATRLAEAIVSARPTAKVSDQEADRFVVHGLSAAQIGDLAHQHHLVLHELCTRRTDLEELFLSLTSPAVGAQTAPSEHPTNPGQAQP